MAAFVTSVKAHSWIRANTQLNPGGIIKLPQLSWHIFGVWVSFYTVSISLLRDNFHREKKTTKNYNYNLNPKA